MIRQTLDHLGTGLKEAKSDLKAQIKDLDTDIKDFNNKMDRKFHRLLYLVISGLALSHVKCASCKLS
jgi:flagellar capping protein FliD